MRGELCRANHQRPHRSSVSASLTTFSNASIACEIGRRPIDVVQPRATRPCAKPCAAGSTSKSSWQGSWTLMSSGSSSRPPTTACVRPLTGVPIHRLRRLLRWPRERFDAVLEALRAEQHVDLEALTEPAFDDHATQDSYHVHGQCYVRLTWRA